MRATKPGRGEARCAKTSRGSHPDWCCWSRWSWSQHPTHSYLQTRSFKMESIQLKYDDHRQTALLISVAINAWWSAVMILLPTSEVVEFSARSRESLRENPVQSLSLCQQLRTYSSCTHSYIDDWMARFHWATCEAFSLGQTVQATWKNTHFLRTANSHSA